VFDDAAAKSRPILEGMQSASNLRVTQHARKLATDVYRVTATFPTSERFGLTAQMRRAAVSIGSNIAEGCGRAGDRELAHFLHIAMGSASELEFQSLIAGDLEFLSPEAAQPLAFDISRVKKMLARLIKALKAKPR
jgi:four helix bundle protein